MASVNITIKKEAYNLLRRMKGKDKSFSEIILDLKRRKIPLDFFGVLKDKDWKLSEKRMKDFRKSFVERLKT